MCHTSDICVLCMVTSVTWSWPWTELNIKHLLNQCLALCFRSTRGKFWPKTDNFEVSTARNLKAPILTFDLTFTWHVTSFGKFRGCFRIVSSRAFKRRIVRLSAAIRSRVMTWGRLTPPPPPASRGWRSTPANAGLRKQQNITNIHLNVCKGLCELNFQLLNVIPSFDANGLERKTKKLSFTIKQKETTL